MISARLEAKDFIADYKKKALRFPRATNAAINDMASQTKTFISKEIRTEYNIKASDLNKNFKLKRSTWKTLNARIEGTGKGISIRKFAAKSQLKSFGDYKRFAITAKIKKSGSRKIIPGVFGLRGKLSTTVKLKNGKIVKAFGPGVANMFNDKIKAKADRFIQVKFPVIFERMIKFMNQ